MWLTALLLGFAGSMHCLGMCSPLVMAVTSMKPDAVFNRLIYNTGRIFTYACMGTVVASAGMILPLHKLQNMVSLSLGIVLLVLGFGGVRNIRIPGISSAVRQLTSFLKGVFARQLKKRNHGTMFILGSLNGLLPCGLSLIALTWCLTLKSPLDGFNFMLLFGTGTLPVMLGLTGVVPFVVNKFNWSIQKLTMSMLIFSGVALIVRVFLVHLPHTSPDGGLMDIIICQ